MRELVERARSGDADAFSALTEERTARLYATAWLVLRDADAAADAVQDALLAAWLDLRSLRDPDRFDAWLYRVLVRSCRHAAQRGRRRRVVEIAVADGRSAAVGDAQVLSDGEELTATIDDGHWLAWWPSDATISRLYAVDQDGAIVDEVETSRLH